MPKDKKPSTTVAFKDGINEGVARTYADAFEGHVAGFDGDRFVADVLAELDRLELKARVEHVARTLYAHLEEDYEVGLSVFMKMLEAREVSEGPSIQFAHWPMAHFVELFGVEHFESSTRAMKEITRHFSCEFAVRPFLVRYPERMHAVMLEWAADEDVHVRRNASEGIRPRLPWGARLSAYVEDPEPVFEVLELLRKDPEEYVRRSVANCLNDVAKDHPEAMMDVLERWDEDPDASSAWIKNRALRTLVKAGDARALGLLGFGAAEVEIEGLATDAPGYTLGETMTFSFAIVSTSTEPQRLMVDYRVHYVKARGPRTAKVFKLKTVELEPGGRVEVVKRQHLAPISTRRYHAGTHALDIQVNGASFEAVEFELEL